MGREEGANPFLDIKNTALHMNAASCESVYAKTEMTLDCFIYRSSSFFTKADHPQSRVISVVSCYLTSFCVPRFLLLTGPFTGVASDSLFHVDDFNEPSFPGSAPFSFRPEQALWVTTVMLSVCSSLFCDYIISVETVFCKME